VGGAAASGALARARALGPRGALELTAAVARDRWFDLRNGTDTCTPVSLDALAIDSANRSHGIAYSASRAADFDRALRALGLPPGRVFVDIGCGKGRTLLQASLHPFARVAGVEFSGQLCAVARRNAEAFRARHAAARPIEVHEADAAQRPFAPDEDVLYLFNPFRAAVLEGVLARLAASLDERPRPLWLLYNNPVQREVVERSGLFGDPAPLRFGRSRFLVYRRHGG
jgi:SAM-dependent methyltransferase